MDSYGKSKVYIATAQPLDAEMQGRINAHRAQRGPDWRMVEAPMDAACAIAGVAEGEVALLDCATMWLTNQMLAEADLEQTKQALLAAIETCAGDLVVVSNEVGLSVVPDNALARAFRDEQGALNHRLAGICDLAVLVAAGLPLVLKGALPEGFT